MVRKQIYFFILLGLNFTAFAQADVSEKSSVSDRIYTGGGLGFSSNNGVTSLSVSPILGYMFTQRFSGGIGVTYQYNSFRFLDINTSNYGGSLFARYNLSEELFGYAEYEYLNFEFVEALDRTVRQDFASIFTGLGYSVPIGRLAAAYVIGLYNLSYNENTPSPYRSPILIRAGITASLR